MPGERRRLMADAFLQVAVGRDDPGAVVHQAFAEPGGEVPFGQRHADGGRDALAERAGGGLDARMLAEFRVAGGGGMELAEAAQLLDSHARMPGQVQQGIEQHGPVAGGQHEAVAVGPARVGGVVFQEAGEQDRRDIGHAHRHAGVAGLRRLHRVDGEGADRIRHVPRLGRRAGEEGGLKRLGGGGFRVRLGLGCDAGQQRYPGRVRRARPL